jgi:hypothetical protein
VISSSQVLCSLPRVIVMMEKLVEWTVLAGGTEVLGENVPRRHFFHHHKSHLPDPGANPGRRGGKPATKNASAMALPLNVTLAYWIDNCHKRLKSLEYKCRKFFSFVQQWFSPVW